MIPAFFINLDKHELRRAHIEGQLSGAKIAAERVAGIDGRNLPREIASSFSFSDRLSPGQVGCYGSHLQIMQIITGRGIDAALILEDDAVLAPDLSSVVTEALSALPPGWDIVRLCSPPKRAVKPIAAICGGRYVVQYSRIPLSTAGYLVSQAGAAKLLRPRHIELPIDVEIARSWLLKLSVFGIAPPPIRQNTEDLATTIPDYTPVSHSILPNARRVAYNIKSLGPYWWGRCLIQNITRKFHRGGVSLAFVSEPDAR